MAERLLIAQAEFSKHTGLQVGDRLAGGGQFHRPAQHLLAYRPLRIGQPLKQRCKNQVGLWGWTRCSFPYSRQQQGKLAFQYISGGKCPDTGPDSRFRRIITGQYDDFGVCLHTDPSRRLHSIQFTSGQLQIHQHNIRFPAQGDLQRLSPVFTDCGKLHIRLSTDHLLQQIAEIRIVIHR